MPVKTYGIYLAYPPTVDLRAQGLGRYLTSFLKGASSRTDVNFVIACPSWSQEMINDLLKSERVPTERLQIVSPRGKPYPLMIFEIYQNYLNRRRSKGLIERIFSVMFSMRLRVSRHMEKRLVRSHSIKTVLPLLLESSALLVLLLVSSPLWIFFLLGKSFLKLARYLIKPVASPINHLLHWVQNLGGAPQDDAWVFRMFSIMSNSEADRMLDMVGRMSNVSAWYCPTAFWPAFNRINAPTLMCVPDVVLADFPVGFSSVGGERYLDTFDTIQEAIRTANHVVTYSEAVKWNTLIDRYALAHDKIHVIPHAPQNLDNWVKISDFPDEEAASRAYCLQLLRVAFQQSANSDPSYVSDFNNENLRFLFYASQFRPNKNVINLLRAYEHLLRKRLVGHKLILTGSPYETPQIIDFLIEHNLENDVLCLPGLTSAQLAACYKLADLAVNPSLSEGGCPFTFSEALSVDTPVVMADIAVTREVLDDPELQQVTFFDPYDWEDIAYRIEWALSNRDELLHVQRKTYGVLNQRTWTNVANEHIALLEQISGEPVKGST